MGSAYPLRGCSVLIVEDEPLIALDLHRAISAAGASVLAANSVSDALDLIAYAQIAAAVVDVNLGSQDCGPVCAALRKRQIPFMFYTGYQSEQMFELWKDAPVAVK